MKPENFDYISKLLHRESGLVLTPEKTYLLDSRLMPLARDRKLMDIDSLMELMRKTPDPALVTQVVDAMTTNESFFFRDQKPFDLFRDMVLPYMQGSRAEGKKLRIWCAACSSGQEPYSLAMLIKEQGPKLAGWRIEIIGTDISRAMLARAESGLYSQFEVQRGLPMQMLVKYFEKSDDRWKISPEITKMVSFRYLNLLEEPGPLGVFDVIFCRNVLIYFDNETKRTVFSKLRKLIANDGFLYLGGAETVLGVTDEFAPIPGRRGVYATSDGLETHLAPALAS